MRTMNSASTLEFVLTGLLRQKPQSGYDLRKAFTTTAMRHFSDSPGSIYPALKRLNARGRLSSEPAAPSQPENRRGRQVFDLTAAGDAALIERLGLPAYQSGIEGFEAQLAWARRARARLAEEAR